MDNDNNNNCKIYNFELTPKSFALLREKKCIHMAKTRKKKKRLAKIPQHQ